MRISSQPVSLNRRKGLQFFLAILAISCGLTYAQTVNILHSFDLYDGLGSQPWAGVVQGTDGNFYGTTIAGGSGTNCACGAVFRISPSGSFTNLHSFDGADGANPVASLVQGSDGNFYGTTSNGGLSTNCSGGCGTVFEITPQGAFTSLYSFGSGTNVNDGSSPQGALVQGSDGDFYGTASGGGRWQDGIVFKISSNGCYSVLYNFSGLDGASPQAALVKASDGYFYGTTGGGGTNRCQCGTMFRLDSCGNLTNIFSFDSSNPGADPLELVQGQNGDFYGVTAADVFPFDYGTVFRISPGGNCTPLWGFSNGADGGGPWAGLVQGSDGNFYGTTSHGGEGGGTLFRVSPAGSFSTLYEFSQLSYSKSILVQGTDGSFYGTSLFGGTSTNCVGIGCGVVFQFSIPLSPPANQIDTVRLANTNVVIGIPSVAGETYQLQSVDALSPGSWSNIPGAVVSNSIGAELSVTNFGEASQPRRFYRFAITP